MLKPPCPMNEAQRLQSLQYLQILDSLAEERFDRISRLCSRLFGVRICLITLVDAHRQWSKSQHGFAQGEIPRNISFCAHTILEERVFVVGDASKDPRFDDNPLVTGEPHIRFYAGCPVHGPGNERIGALCIIDSEARGFSETDQGMLRDLAAMVDDELSMSAPAVIDELTQIANPRGFNMVAGQMLALCRRTGISAELTVFRLDESSSILDQTQNRASKELQRKFANLLLRCFRDADVLARLDGQMFAVFMAGSKLQPDIALQRMGETAASENSHQSCSAPLRWRSGAVRLDPDRHFSVNDLLEEANQALCEQNTAVTIAT